MTKDQLLAANLNNLTDLWTHLGATTEGESGESVLRSSNAWPHRLWEEQPFGGKTPLNDKQLELFRPFLD